MNKEKIRKEFLKYIKQLAKDGDTDGLEEVMEDCVIEEDMPNGMYFKNYQEFFDEDSKDGNILSIAEYYLDEFILRNDYEDDFEKINKDDEYKFFYNDLVADACEILLDNKKGVKANIDCAKRGHDDYNKV